MIKKMLLVILFIASFQLITFGQDTTAYEIQRAKINALLAQRSAKFGQYDQSLNNKTGIFGFQTKKDIRNSNEILRQIALTDNDIFKELKILLDYKDLQVEQVKSSIAYNTENILSYRKTIKQLQDQNQGFRDHINHLERGNIFTYLIMIILVAISICLGYFLRKRTLLLKSYEKRSI